MNRYLFGAVAALALIAGPAVAANVTLLGGTSQGLPNTGTNNVLSFGASYQGNTPGGAVWSVDPYVGGGSVDSIYKSPFANTVANDTFSYFSVGGGFGAPQGTDTQPVSLTFLNPNTYASSARILWGSIDEYNTLDFLRDGVSVGQFLGTTMANLIGVPGYNTSNFEKVGLFNFYDFGPGGFNEVKFSSTSRAFEFGLDPLSITTLSAVPIPAALPLFGTALGGLFLLRHKARARRNSTPA